MTTLDHDWFPAPLPHNVELGDGSWLYSSYAFLHFRSVQPIGFRAGRHCGIYIGTMLDLGPAAAMTLGDYSILNGCIISTNGQVDIGSYALIAHEVTLGGTAFAAPPTDDADVDPPITIGDDAWIGVRATVLGGAVIGRGAIVGAATVVSGEVPDYAIVAGNPARIVGEARPRTGREQGHGPLASKSLPTPSSPSPQS